MNLSEILIEKVNNVIEGVPKKYVRGNIAYATFKYRGCQRDFLTSSKIHQRKYINGYNFSSPKGTDYFSYLDVNTEGIVNGNNSYSRIKDTEAKIFGLLVELIDMESITEGEIFIYTTNIPCISCYYVLDQFRREFPTFSVDVYSHDNFSIHIERE